MARFRNGAIRRKPNLVFSVFLIIAGVVLFLANLELLPISVHEVWKLWPLIFVAVGIGKVVNCQQPSALILGGLLAAFGVIFTLVNVGFIHVHFNDDSWPLSLLFLGLGIGGLAKVLDTGNSRWRRAMRSDPATVDPNAQTTPPWPTRENWTGWSQSAETDNSPVIDNVAVMAGIKRRVESVNFQGGTLTAIWGSIELDLRRARLPEGQNSVVVDANAVMGSIKLRIPETWRVAWNGLSIMASFEDKTDPPIIGKAAPELIMTGYLLMGSIEVES